MAEVGERERTPAETQRADARVAWKHKIDRLLDPKDEVARSYVKYNPESSLTLIAEQRLQIELFRRDDWGKSQHSWHCGLIPENEVVEDVGATERYWVAKTHDCAFQAWPALSDESGAVRPDLSVGKLDWKFVFDMTQIVVLPAKARSPLVALIEGRPPTLERLRPKPNRGAFLA